MDREDEYYSRFDFGNRPIRLARSLSVASQQRLFTTKEKNPRNPLLKTHSPIGMQDDLYKLQLNAEEIKDFTSFKNTIEDNLKKYPSAEDVYLNTTHLEETCLDIASKNGLTEFVKSLLDHGANPNKINNAQNRAPIHFATEGGHVDTLKALLLHPRINPNLQVKGQTALHIAVEKNDLHCARLLLERGASATIPDSEGVTAPHLAARKNQWDMVELIRQKRQQCSNLVEYEDNGTTRQYGQTRREYVIQQKMPKLSLSPILEDTEKVFLQDLKHYLSINDEKNFIKIIYEYKSDVSLFLLDPQEVPCKLQILEELLKMAAERDFYKAVMAIRKKFYESMFRVKLGIWKAARIALHQGYCDTLRELLNIGLLEPVVANDLILDACTELEMLGSRVVDGISNHLECLKLILEKGRASVHFADNEGNTPLHYAARTGCHEAMALFLKRGSYIGHMNKFNEPPIAKIPAYTLSKHFDNCMQIKENIEFDYRCLMPHQIVEKHYETVTTTCEMETFMYIARNEDLKHLLKHPLLSTFLYMKWYRIRYFLYANFIFYFIFYLFLNAYILCMYGTRKENETQIANGSSHTVSGSSVTTDWYQDSLSWAVIAMLSLLISREILQLTFCPWRYLTDLRSWLQIVLITLILVILCNASIEIGVVVILLSTWELVILIGYHPRMSIGIEMFRTVSFNFARFLYPYLFLIFAFALIFYKFFKDSNDDANFSDPGLSLFKTVIMFTSEFEVSDVLFTSEPVWSRMFFVLFVFLIAIVLFNLLNGLAVSDTTEILSTAELVGLISRIRLIVYFENVMKDNPFRFRLLRCNPFSFFTRRIFLFPHYMRNGIIKFVSNSDNNSDNSDMYYMHNKFGTLDPNIIRNIKQITSSKNQMSSNRRIMIMLKKLQEEMTMIEVALNDVLKFKT